jgi:hypothetical protein
LLTADQEDPPVKGGFIILKFIGKKNILQQTIVSCPAGQGRVVFS